MGNKIMRIVLGIAALCCAVVLAGSPAISEPRYDLHNDLVAYSAIERQGRLDLITPGSAERPASVTIDDRSFALDEDCIFRNSYGGRTSLDAFETGMNVGYFVVDDKTITKMWHDAEQETGSDQPPPELTPDSSGSAGDEIRFEDGVWRN